jgi:hypothetical protein
MSDPALGRIFISYRRAESRDLAGRLYDRLASRFGDAQVFMDVGTIALGADFTKVITKAVGNCQVLLAVIGPHWLSVTGEDGRRRLDDPDDIVRLEIAAALERDILVIPILAEGAVMPRRAELPENLARLAQRNALSLRHASFPSDTDRLLAEIEPIVGRLAPKKVVSEQWDMCRTDTLPHPNDKIGLLQTALRSIFFPVSNKGYVLAAKWITGPNPGEIVRDSKGRLIQSAEFEMRGDKRDETYAAMDQVFGMLLDDDGDGNDLTWAWEMLPPPTNPYHQVYKREFRRRHRG